MTPLLGNRMLSRMAQPCPKVTICLGVRQLVMHKSAMGSW